MTRSDAPPPSDAILDRYLAGEATDAERIAVERWLAADPSRHEWLSRLRSMGTPPSIAKLGDDVSGMWAKVGQRVAEDESHPSRAAASASLRASVAISNAPGRRLLRPLRGLAMTGALLGCVTLAALLVRAPHRTGSESRGYATRAGQRESVTLSDGTRFTLAPASHLRVPVDYAAGNRRVVLDGEAYFAVVHDVRHPFSVRARDAVITDIGTRFDVRAYGDGEATRVAVSEGRVAVGVAPAGLGTVCDRPCAAASTIGTKEGATGSARAMVGGDVATVTDTVVAITHGAEVGALTSWADGRLAFHNKPLAEVARDLGCWYDLDVNIAPGVNSGLPLTAAFTTEPVDDVLSVVATTLGLHVERRGRTVTFVPGA